MKNIYLQLFLAYAKIGAVTFGGGYAMLPIIKREVVDKRGWSTEQDVIDSYAIGQCTPGVIAVNSATLVGYQKGGVLGAVCATVGVVSVPILIIISIASVIEAYAENVYVQHALAGMSVAICAIIAVTVAKLIKKSCKDIPTIAIAAIVLALSLAFDLSTVLLVVCAALAGVVINGIKSAKGKKEV